MPNPVRHDPQELMQQARQGDNSALGRLLELYRSYLQLLARLQLARRLQAKVDPSDLVQDAFLVAHRHFAQFQGTSEGELLGWLRQIMASRLARTMRHYQGTKRRNIALERELAGDLAASSGALVESLIARQSSPSERAGRREQAAVLAEVLDQLPTDYREVIILRHLEGLRFPEVADWSTSARLPRS
jgi:RNA polymerase sigma-70 factor (ECF subfamily)